MQSKIFSFVCVETPPPSASFISPFLHCDFLTASIPFYFSSLPSLAGRHQPVRLGGRLKFRTLFNVLLACLFLFMPARFYEVFNHLIFAPFPSLSASPPPPPLSPLHLNFISLSPSLGCFTASPQSTFSEEENEDRTRNSGEIQKHHMQGPSLPLVITQYSARVPKTASPH